MTDQLPGVHPLPGDPGTAPFVDRHVGPDADAVAKMLAALGHEDLESLVRTAVPASILDLALELPPPASEVEVLAELRELASLNKPTTTMIGLGYAATVLPPVIQRNVLESPAWYTAYTPYQPEISQGRLEALLNFQTVITDLTGLPVAGASLLDESTAAAEGMQLARRTVRQPAGSTDSGTFLVDAETLPQTLAVLQTRAEPLGISVAIVDFSAGWPTEVPDGVFGVLLQQPGASGVVRDLAPLISSARAAGAVTVVAVDLLSLTLLTPPGEQGADVVVGSTQRFGLPMAFGGPHAGFMSVRSGLERSLPGRLVGVSVDAEGAPAYRLALQTREQHIRREKATSNICTAQVLPAVLSSMFAAWHGAEGLIAIAQRAHRRAVVLAAGLRSGGIPLQSQAFFDTIVAEVPGRADEVIAAALDLGVNLRRVSADQVAIACDETTELPHLRAVWQAFGVPLADLDEVALDAGSADALPAGLLRQSPFLTHPVFSQHRTETAMLRYLRRLADTDLALDRTMIPLGSCTMKLNATTEMAAVTWPEFASIHPFAPLPQAAGYLRMISELESWLCAVTGYDRVSLQPNAGSQGELAGLLAIRGWHRSRSESHRDVCLIPSSAHGTNAASAAMAGMRVVVVACDTAGNVDLDDLKAKLAAHAEDLAALMVTYPSTHGVYEASIGEICSLVHAAGGQVYVDGANLNALVGLAKPGAFGADVSHLNLHKTFCIPHGGGGPGVGPVAVRAHLADFLPSHPLVPALSVGVGPVSGAPWGSAGILMIPWAYVRLMGADGLRQATSVAVLSANYLAARLQPHFPVLYTGAGGLVAHECILDLRGITRDTGVTVDDVAKRLIDHGFHAPTMSFPVPGTLMVEPTESEDLPELERFVAAMVSIREEISRVAAGEWSAEESPLRGAPHTAACVTADEWTKAYPRSLAAYPSGASPAKYWPPVRRIDQAFGDRNLVCSCPPMSSYA